MASESTLFEKAKERYSTEGGARLCIDATNFLITKVATRFVLGYNATLRARLPKQGTYPVATDTVKMGGPYEKRLFDDVTPWRTPYNNPRWGTWENYEPELIETLQSHVQEGDSVVIVGAGRGATTVVAAKATGSSGHVVSYEADPQRVPICRSTVKVNNVSDRVNVKGEVVGEAVHVADMETVNQQSTIGVEELPDCDVLELDCEGAELAILSELQIEPETLIVETHGCYGAPESEVRSLLSKLGYQVITRNPQDEGRDIIILTANRQTN